MSKRGKGFADIAYTMLVVNKQYAVQDVAIGLGMTYATLHSRLINRTCFSADEIRGFIAVAPNTKLVAYLLAGTPYVAADRVSVQANIHATIQKSATHVVVNAAHILDAIDRALEDQRIDHREGAEILSEIDRALRTLTSLKLKIEAAGTKTMASNTQAGE